MFDQRGTKVPDPRGGKRPGAGRKPNGPRAGSPHTKRPALNSRNPVHVTLRVVRAIGNLRRRHMYQAIREATLVAARRDSCRIVHVSIQSDHIHLLVEADNKTALASGLQGFQISAAKHLNAKVGTVTGGPRRRGTVFPDRYHAEVIGSRRQARHALAYVLNNWRKHEQDRDRSWAIDPFSSALSFTGWKERADEPFLWRGPDTYDPLIVYQPKTWLLSEGWKYYGLISFREVPKKRR